MKFVVSFFQIDFDHHPFPIGLNSHGMNHLLGNNEIVSDIPTYNKTNLLLHDDLKENEFKTVSN